MLELLEKVTTSLEKPYVQREAFQHFRTEIDKLVETFMKYCEHLRYTNTMQQQSSLHCDEPEYKNPVFELPKSDNLACFTGLNRSHANDIINILNDFFLPKPLQELLTIMKKI